MADIAPKRLSKVLGELNISLGSAVEYLEKKGIEIKADPNAKIEADAVALLEEGFAAEKSKKQLVDNINQGRREEKEKKQAEKEQAVVAKEAEAAEKTTKTVPDAKETGPERKETSGEEKVAVQKPELKGLKVLGKIDLSPKNKAEPSPVKEKKPEKEEKSAEEKVVCKPSEDVQSKHAQEKQPQAAGEQAAGTNIAANHRETQYQKLEGPKILNKIDLAQFEKKPDAQSSAASADRKKRRRKRGEKISGDQLVRPQQAAVNPVAAGQKTKANKGKVGGRIEKVEPSEEEISRQIKETLEKLTQKSGKNKAAKYRREKRDLRAHQSEMQAELEAEQSRILKVTEFLTVSELASMMNVPVTQVIAACMTLGIMATMNQRLDAETIVVLADEFGFEVEFVSADLEEAVADTPDSEDELEPCAPIVTVMGHVDHGKTSLLDYVRRANVIAGEAGGITQHIAAYRVKLEHGQKITFLDTPGHEAFTAMRARGAQVTDIAIIVIAADSDVMPQTKEAISHAQAAGVPMVFAINKSDLPTANPDKIRESLAGMNILVEEWGGKYQSQEISSKTGSGVNELLDKVLLEAEMLDLKANPNKNASGTVIEASLDKGRGYQTTVLVQNGSLKIGDYMLAGQNSGKVKAMFDERGNKVIKAGPSKPVLVLGLDGAPTAGDKFVVLSDEKEAKNIAARRMQLKREQNIRTSKHITLDEIGRRIAIGDFRELNIIIKGDVDGSVEALTDSLQNLSTEKIHINIIYRGVGQISESDVLLASASEAVIIGFNVRPSAAAKRLAEQEEIDIRTYSIIYDAINEVKDAMEGMLAPEFKEEIVCNVEVRQVYKISKVGTIAGCMVLDGKITRNTKIRVIRDGIVIHQGVLESLKRFKDDVKDVSKGYECGLNIEKFNDIEAGDIIEGYQFVEHKPKL